MVSRSLSYICLGNGGRVGEDELGVHFVVAGEDDACTVLLHTEGVAEVEVLDGVPIEKLCRHQDGSNLQ